MSAGTFLVCSACAKESHPMTSRLEQQHLKVVSLHQLHGVGG